MRGRQTAGDRGGVVGAGVVDDRDERPEGEGLVEEGAQRGDALRQLRRLVVDRDDDLDVHRDPAGIDVGLEGSQGCHVRHGAGAVSGLREARLWIWCESQAARARARPGQAAAGGDSSDTVPGRGPAAPRRRGAAR